MFDGLPLGRAEHGHRAIDSGHIFRIELAAQNGRIGIFDQEEKEVAFVLRENRVMDSKFGSLTAPAQDYEDHDGNWE